MIYAALLCGLCTACGSDEPVKKQEEKVFLESLTADWRISSAKLGSIDRTGEFLNDDFTLTIKGQYDADHPKGPHVYEVKGRLPYLSPWNRMGGVWSFGSPSSSQIIRDDGVEIKYVVTGDKLTLDFYCSSCGTTNGRTRSVDGEWSFIFSRVK